MSLRDMLNGGALVERVVLLLVVGGLGYACLQIVSPFIPAFIWATILVLSTWPYYLSLSNWMAGRRKLAAITLTLLMLIGFVVPTILAMTALAENLPSLESSLGKLVEWVSGEPPEWLTGLPLIGEKIDFELRSGHIKSLLDPSKLRPRHQCSDGHTRCSDCRTFLFARRKSGLRSRKARSKDRW